MTGAAGSADPVYDAVAAFAARLADLGVAHVVVSPGSRSTPLTLCLDAEPRLTTWIQIDERSAGYFAVGLGRATGLPAVLVCTSGTAAANYLPAVVEACHAGVPLIVCTADRPPELRRGWGSPQTIDQVGLYGPVARLSSDLPVAGEMPAADAVKWANLAFKAAVGADRGPVHLNWPFREPLEPLHGVPTSAAAATAKTKQSVLMLEPLPGVPTSAAERDVSSVLTGSDGRSDKLETRQPGSGSGSDGVVAERSGWGSDGVVAEEPGSGSDGLEAALSHLSEIAAVNERGVVIAGPWPGGGLERERVWAAETLRFAAWAGWPVIGEPISGVRGSVSGESRGSGDADASGCDAAKSQAASSASTGGSGDTDAADCDGVGTACVVATADHLLADKAFGDRMRPDVAVMVGRTVTTKPVRLWLERTKPAHVVQIDPENRWQKAVFRLTGHVPAAVEALSAITATVRAPALAAGRGSAGSWLDAWRTADEAARRALAAAVGEAPLLSALLSRTLVNALPRDGVLVCSSSMPVRDLDAFVTRTRSLSCVANRGVAGIDGTVSTALGLAAADPGRTTALYTGDLALLHDLAALTAAQRLGLHLTVVCVDNDGGEIFSLLPVADCLAPSDFERLFRTPHGVRFRDLDGFGGIRACQAATAAELFEAVSAAAARRAPGVDLIVSKVSPEADVAQRRALTESVRAAVAEALRCGS